MDGGAPVSAVHTMEEVVAGSTAAPRFYLLLLAGFAAVAVVLAAVGVYGVMSYAVSRRTNEIGIRMALGAKPADVRWMVVGQGMAVALGGAAAGLWARSAHPPDVGPSLRCGPGSGDVPGRVARLGLVALAASYIPARRATRIDPLRALRCE
jgi:putative ABC transport system permease protein